MTDSEFGDWLQFHIDCFPDLAKWLDSSERESATIKAWMMALEDCDFADCMMATKAMLKGDIDAPEAYERERIPSMIRKFCKAARSERTQRERDRQTLQQAAGSGKCQPIGPLLREARELGFAKRDGEIGEEEHAAKLADILKRAGSDPKAPEPRFSCPDCCDSGVVMVWHPREVNKYKRTKQQPRRIGAAVSCRCSNAKKARDTYDDRVHWRIRFGTPTAAEEPEMMAWVDGTARRHSDFDDWGGSEIL